MATLLAGGAVSLVFTLFLTPLFIRLFHRLQWGQFIRDDGPVTHHAKRGTATMGGVVILLAAVIGYFAGHLVGGTGTPVTVSGLLVLLLTVGLGLVGFVDDLLKTRHQRSLGLGGWAKILGQVVVATVFAVLALQFPRSGQGATGRTLEVTPASTRVSIVRDQWFDGSVLDFRTLGTIVGALIFVVWIWLIVTSTSNGVNVADGLDGLATGASIFAIGSYIIIGFWQSNQWCFDPDLMENVALCYDVRDPLDLAIVAACITGALVGFLWWNTSPAQIFMGDTGSLGLGGALAALAVLSRTELLLLFVGGLFVIEPGSVIVQRIYFKATHGRRIFLMSPIHHHFELKGWAEVTVVVRFWIIGGLLSVLGVGLFYLEWLTRAS